MGPVSFNGGHPSVVRVRNVTSTGFQFQIDEWDYLDGGHATETIGYLVLEAGSHTLTDGTKMVAGKTTANHKWRNVSLSDFDNTPVVLAQVTSVKASAAVTTRLRQVANAGFQVRVQEEQANNGVHATEQISYVAIETVAGLTEGLKFEAALTPDSVTHATTDIAFLETFDSVPILLAGIQTSDGGDTSALRFSALSATGASLFIEEERSADSETDHTTEVVGYFALDGGVIRALAVEPNTTPLPQAGAIGESGSVTAGQADKSTWQSVSFARSYADPVVVMGPPSYVGAHPLTVRVRNVTSNGFQFQIDEWDYLDGAHAAESIGYLVVEAGSHALADGTKLVAGKTTASHAWKGVSLSGLSGTPVVLAQVAGVAESSAVTVRLRNASAASFQIRLQEEQASDGLHAAEQINYVAIETARGATEGVRFESALTSDSIRHTTSNVGFAQAFRSTPVFLANIQSFDGTDPAALRHSSLTTTGAGLFAEEERSADSEINHASEVVGYFALEAGLIDVPQASSSAADTTLPPGGFDLGVLRTSSKTSAPVAQSESAQPPSPTGSRATTPPLLAEPRHFRGAGSSSFSVAVSLLERGNWNFSLDDALMELLASAWRRA
jgi:metal-dependent HD superfamily phosphatase/phosphodiesterase